MVTPYSGYNLIGISPLVVPEYIRDSTIAAGLAIRIGKFKLESRGEFGGELLK
jgi:hypothetical protein